MLFKDEDYTTQDFIEVFDKKFSNFCDKAPIVLSYKLTPVGCQLRNLFNQDFYEHRFDFTREVSSNINDIKVWMLENWYPVMVKTGVEYEDYTAQEIEKIMIEEGLTLEEALKRKNKKQEIREEWRIEKVILRRDELFVRNLSTDQFFRYRMHMPTTVFLQRIRDRYTPEEAFKIFSEKSILITELTKKE